MQALLDSSYGAMGGDPDGSLAGEVLRILGIVAGRVILVGAVVGYNVSRN